jgi:hypothetical protein
MRLCFALFTLTYARTIYSLSLSEFSLSLSSSQTTSLCGVDLARLAPESSKQLKYNEEKNHHFFPQTTTHFGG